MIGETLQSISHGYVRELDSSLSMSTPVEPGESISIRTIDSSGGQVNASVAYSDLDPNEFFPVAGPIRIDGVRKGDTVGIEILNIVPDPRAYTWTRPGLGLIPQPAFRVLELDSELLEIRPRGSSSPAIGVAPRKLHIGALGLLPNAPILARSLGHHGGNLDFHGIGIGATVWLTAQVDGGGFFAGDVHVTIGDGEICGTGAETGADVSVKFHHIPAEEQILPTVRDSEGKHWVIGIGDSVEEALTEATTYCVARFAAHHNITPEEAYLIVGLLLNVNVCQVVNPRTSVAVSLENGFDSVLHVATA